MRIWLKRIRRIFLLPLPELKKAVRFRIKGAIFAVQDKITAHLAATYAVGYRPRQALKRIIPALPVCFTIEQKDLLRELSRRYTTHCFDLLGSGWTSWSHQRQQSQVNLVNSREAQAVWRLIEGPYQALDWHKDIKSGFCWPKAVWHSAVKWGTISGADIKVPWELARMQHLAVLAWMFAAADGQVAEFELKENCVREFRNQLVDFIAHNPPGFGVNWSCAMEVAIRAVNWLVSFDLFRGFGACFDDAFCRLLQRSIYEHGRHCYRNLEYSATGRNNHYLANLAGLLIITAYLPSDRQTSRWQTLARQELPQEIQRQFNPDGSNFEASTCYHRLSAEIVFYAALLGGLGLSAEVWARLERAVQFTLDTQKPNGNAPQIGDNDNGRFFKLWPCMKWASGELRENTLDHRHLLQIAGTIFQRTDFAAAAGKVTPEKLVSEALLNRMQSAPRQSIGVFSAKTDGFGQPLAAHIPRLRRYGGVIRHVFAAASGDLLDNLTLYHYPDFGLYLYKSSRLYLAIRCGSLRGQLLGHAHNDQLSLELTIDGRDLIRDPGSYVYSACPDERNRYRSTAAHFTPQRQGCEQHEWPPGAAGVFQLKKHTQAHCLCFSREGFAGEHAGFGSPVARIVRLLPDCIEVLDFGGDRQEISAVPYSDGYGRLDRG